MFNKIFCIGFNKTGTSSMHQLFLDLGLRSYHGIYSHFPIEDPIFGRFECFSDGNEHPFEQLDQTYPGSRFIVTTRALDDWLVSRSDTLRNDAGSALRVACVWNTMPIRRPLCASGCTPGWIITNGS